MRLSSELNLIRSWFAHSSLTSLRMMTSYSLSLESSTNCESKSICTDPGFPSDALPSPLHSAPESNFSAVIRKRNFREGIALSDLDHYRERGLEVCRNLNIKVSRGTPYHDPGELFSHLLTQSDSELTAGGVQYLSRTSNNLLRRVRQLLFMTLLKNLLVR